MKNPFTKTRELKKIKLRSSTPEEPKEYFAEVIEWKIFGWTWWDSQIPLWQATEENWIAKHISLT